MQKFKNVSTIAAMFSVLFSIMLGQRFPMHTSCDRQDTSWSLSRVWLDLLLCASYVRVRGKSNVKFIY